jgi:hypothetical protein
MIFPHYSAAAMVSLATSSLEVKGNHDTAGSDAPYRKLEAPRLGGRAL